jgi:hypothetical protein
MEANRAREQRNIQTASLGGETRACWCHVEMKARLESVSGV